MNHQWTTISESVKKAREDTRQIVTPSRDDTRKNKRIAVALASVGVFLILVGAAPFVFTGGEDPSDYAAYLGQDPEMIIANSVPEEGENVGIVARTDEPTSDFGAEPVDISLSVDTEIPLAKDGEPLETVAPTETPIMDEIILDSSPVETPITPAPPEKPYGTTPLPIDGSLGNDEVRSEYVEFPVNVHVDGSAEPVDFSTVVGENFHMAAPKQPSSGVPALPLLAFSGAAAAWLRRRNAKQSH